MQFSHELFGIIAGVIELVAFVPYIVSIFRGKTIPHRGSWIIWTILGFVLLMSYRAAGAEETIWVPLMMFLGPLVITVLSMRYGTGGWEDSLDRYCLVGALVAIVCYFIFDTPLVALSIAILTDVFAAIPTVRKSIWQPYSEDVIAWSLAFIASILNIAAIDTWNLSIAGYPIYASIIFAAICIPLWKYRVLR